MSDGTAKVAKPAALTPDICVIGAGGNGIALATAAAAFGVSVVLVEREVLGGSPAPSPPRPWSRPQRRLKRPGRPAGSA